MPLKFQLVVFLLVGGFCYFLGKSSVKQIPVKQESVQTVQNDIMTVTREKILPNGTKTITTKTNDKSVKAVIEHKEELIPARKPISKYRIGAGFDNVLRDLHQYRFDGGVRLYGPLWFDGGINSRGEVSARLSWEF